MTNNQIKRTVSIKSPRTILPKRTNKSKTLIHPSKRDYSNIRPYSDQKYCSSIFNKGWSLKTTTLVEQYRWFVKFEENIFSKMDPNHLDSSKRPISGSSGIILTNLINVIVRYDVIDNTLFLTILGKNNDEFIKMGNNYGFDYGKVNQCGISLRSRKLQTWGFLDFIQLDRYAYKDGRLFKIDLDLYEDYKNRITYVINEKTSWLNYSLHKKTVMRPATYSEENKSANWVRQLKKMKSKKTREFFFNNIERVKNSDDFINRFNNLCEYTFTDYKLAADECLAMALQQGSKGTLNSTMTKIINQIRPRYSHNKIVTSTKVVLAISPEDRYLASNGFKVIEPDNENRGATRIFKNRLMNYLKKDPKTSPLVKFGLLSEHQYKQCRFELAWGIRDHFKGFIMADNFAPDILITNGKTGKEREIFAVIQLKGKTRNATTHHPTAILYQILELKKYEIDTGIKSAMVVIEKDSDNKTIRYNWLTFDFQKCHCQEDTINKLFTSLNNKNFQLRSSTNLFIDPLLPRNARSSEIVIKIHDKVAFSHDPLTAIIDYSKKKIAQRTYQAFMNFSLFSSGRINFTNEDKKFLKTLINNYINDIIEKTKQVIIRLKKGTIYNYPLFQSIWNNEIYHHYFTNLQKYLKV